MALRKITSADTFDKGVIGLPDSPNLSATDMQKKFDELALEVIIPIFNILVDQILEKLNIQCLAYLNLLSICYNVRGHYC